MKPKIFFVKESVSYLPEIYAYTKYCIDHDIDYEIVTPDYNFSLLSSPFIKWVVMGSDRNKNDNAFVVHEYLSLSTGKLPRVKNFLKKNISITPDLQVFLNDHVKKTFSKKSIPSIIRDMGVMPTFKLYSDVEKEYDFVYCGSLGKNRNITELFRLFMDGPLNKFSLLVIGQASTGLLQNYKSDNICFYGRVNYEDVPHVLSRARCAINFIPNVYPFNLQTSTKLLEYLSCKLPVLSTKYRWVEEFKNKTKAPILFIDSTMSHEMIQSFLTQDFTFPDMSKYLWEQILSDSAIFEQVLSGYEEKFRE